MRSARACTVHTCRMKGFSVIADGHCDIMRVRTTGESVCVCVRERERERERDTERERERERERESKEE